MMTLDAHSADPRLDTKQRLVEIADNTGFPVLIRLIAEGVLLLKDIKEGIDKIYTNGVG